MCARADLALTQFPTPTLVEEKHVVPEDFFVEKCLAGQGDVSARGHNHYV